MPTYADNGVTKYEIGKLYADNGTTTYQIGQVYAYNGTTNYLIYTAEESMPDLSTPIVSNYAEWKTTASSTSADSWNLSGFDALTLEWQIGVQMSWANAYGVTSTATMYLRLADGTLVRIAGKTGALWTAGSTYADYGTATIDLSGYTDSQLATVHLYLTLGDMSADYPISGSDRHNAECRVSNVIAS